MASAGSATADRTATGQGTYSIAARQSQIPIPGESVAVAAVTELAEVVEATIKKEVTSKNKVHFSFAVTVSRSVILSEAKELKPLNS
jgi:hypothetical protein